ncbi:MAG: Do family serine endopeptidase [Rhodospirillales bacterium]|nr:Do family serine endopeptidase [Rhodospirillales bacterium]
MTDFNKVLKSRNKGRYVILASVVAAFAGAAVLAGSGGLQSSRAAPSIPAQAVALKPLPAMPVRIADVVDRVIPAVVTVNMTSHGQANGSQAESREFEEFSRRFFGDDGRDRRQGEAPGRRRGHGLEKDGPKKTGLGSGFIIDKKGLIVTNNHVIDGSDEVSVPLNDGRKFEAKILGRDEKTDLALLKVETDKDLPFVEWAASDNVRIGDWVITNGNPFGVGQTVTTGIISARHRNIGAGPFDDYLQIDAPINRGNSGGPTFDTEGKVIGVNTAIFSPSGGNVGIGFAIPSSMAKSIIAELSENGTVQRGWLGVQIQGVTPEIADGLGLKKPSGALIAKVSPASPAMRAGLNRGDVILKVDDHEVKAFGDLPRMIAGIKVGTRTKLGIVRRGKEKSLMVEIGKAPNAIQVSATEPADGTVQGLKLAAIDKDARRNYRLSDAEGGVLIAGVNQSSRAAKAGLTAGDVILAIGDQAVKQPGDVDRFIETALEGKRTTVLLLISRRGGELFVALPIKRA